MMVGLQQQRRGGELFGASYEGLGLLLGKSESRRAYHKKKNGAAVDLKGEG